MNGWKKQLIWFAGIFFISLIVSGNGSKIYAEDVIVPAYLKETDSTASVSTHQYQLSRDTIMLSIPVQILHAGLVVCEVTPKTLADEINIVLSSSIDAGNNNSWIAIGFAASNQTEKLHGYAKGACTWYLHIFIAANDIPEADVTVKAYQKAMGKGDDTLKKGKWNTYYFDKKSTGYYKIKVPSTGILKFEMTSGGGSSLLETNLLNHKKIPVSSEVSTNKVNYYAVKKGTYYVWIRNKDTAWKYCRMRYTFESVKTTKNTTKSKALTLKKGKMAKGLFLSGDKKTERWYKMDISKTQQVTWNIFIKSNAGSYSLSIYQANGTYKKKISLKKENTQKKVKLKKGRYYFVINGQPMGGYSIQWK